MSTQNQCDQMQLKRWNERHLGRAPFPFRSIRRHSDWRVRVEAIVPLKTFALLGCLFLSFAGLSAHTRSVGSSALICLEGFTSEHSCGGTFLRVWLRGEEIHRLDWTIETSRQFIRREYRLEAGRPRSVVETIHQKLDAEGGHLASPRLLSRRRYALAISDPGVHARELQEHAAFLVGDFQTGRRDFTSSAR